MQLEIQQTLDIPEKNFKWFVACNSAHKYFIYKQEFYKLKDKILREYGSFDHYDWQIIKQKCRTCGGSGWYYKDEKCWNCDDNGIFRIKNIALERYILNGILFHKPVGVILNGKIINQGYIIHDTPQFVNTIKGLVEHSESEIHPLYALLLLSYQYDKQMYHLIISDYSKRLQTNAKRKFLNCMRKGKNMIDGFAIYLGIKKEDDLPF